MTDRLNALTIVLEKDIRTDDAEAIINAIRQIRGVLSVDGHVAEISDHIAYERARHDLTTRLLDALKPQEEKAMCNLRLEPTLNCTKRTDFVIALRQ